MKRWLFLTVMLLWVAALAWLLFPGPASLITADQFESLEIGMTQLEVEQILGGPARDDLGQSVIVWAPRGDTLNSMRIDSAATASNIFIKEDVAGTAATASDIFVAAEFPDRDYELVWLSEDGLIAVLFDDEGRMLTKHFSDVTVLERPTALDWLRTRF